MTGRSNLRIGYVVTGYHVKKGDVIGRVAAIMKEGGVLLDLDDGRIAGFGSDEAQTLVVVDVIEAPFETNVFGDRWIVLDPDLPVHQHPRPRPRFDQASLEEASK